MCRVRRVLLRCWLDVIILSQQFDTPGSGTRDPAEGTGRRRMLRYLTSGTHVNHPGRLYAPYCNDMPFSTRNVIYECAFDSGLEAREATNFAFNTLAPTKH
jgi:hypothetical protein